MAEEIYHGFVVKSKEDKKRAVEDIKRAAKAHLESIGIEGDEEANWVANHELSHALGDSSKKGGNFSLAAEGNYIEGGYTSNGTRTLQQAVKALTAPGKEMSPGDKKELARVRRIFKRGKN